MKPERLLARIRAGHLANVRFADFCKLIETHGFRLHRVRGSHRIFKHPGARLELTLTEGRRQAMPYQVRAFLRMVDDYDLKSEDG